MKHRRVLIVAVIAGSLGAVAGQLVQGPGPLWRSDLGQRLLQATGDDAPRGVRVAEVDAPMPALTLTDLDGRSVRLPEAYRGRPLLLNYWASWCAPCVEEMPELQRYSRAQAAHGADGVQVIGIALDKADAVRDFLRRVPVDYPILLEAPGPADSSVQLGNRRGVLPYSVLIDAEGRVRRQRIGPFVAGEIDTFGSELQRNPR